MVVKECEMGNSWRMSFVESSSEVNIEKITLQRRIVN